MMAGEGGKICRYADGVNTVGFRKKHERADAKCRLHGSSSRGNVPPARAKAKAPPAPEPPLEGRGEERHQPRAMGGESEVADHGQVTLFATRKRLHMQCPPDPLDKWISRSIQCHPGGDCVDKATGEALSDAEREEYQQFRERFHKRCKLGVKADRLVRIVDNYLPRLSKENRVFVMKFPNKVEKMLRKARGIRRKIRAKRRKPQGGATTQPKDAPLEGTRPTGERGAAQRGKPYRRHPSRLGEQPRGPGHCRDPRNQ